MTGELRAHLVSFLPESVAVGGGSALYLEGSCDEPLRGSSLVATVGRNEARAVAHGMPAHGAWKPLASWWAVVPLTPVKEASVASVALRARLGDGSTARAEIGRIELTPGAPEGRASATRPSKVAITMATYEPPSALFRRQIDSIRAQTHDDWICVISDDGSSEATIERMKEVLAGDSRFELSASGERLGVYRNFERALGLIPDDASVCAFCDQDDFWYPEKLERLVSELGPGVQLAYSDTRIVSEAGDPIAETYWTHRRNNFTDLGALLLANTVTGAASVFRRELLDLALPFPPRYRDAYHDHWLALCALATGNLAYVPEPLYDYVQHGDSVIGYKEANLPGEKFRRRRARARARSKGISVPHLVYSALRRYYFSVWCQSMVWATALEARCGEAMTPAHRRTVSRLTTERDPRLWGWLALRSLRPGLASSATFARERYVLLALAWRRLVSAAAGISRRVG